MARVLVVDDDATIRSYLHRLIVQSGHHVVSAATLEEGCRCAREAEFDLVFLDVMLPDGNGLNRIGEFRSSISHPEVVILTGAGDAEGAELALRSGAWDYLCKPAQRQEINLQLTRVLQFREATRLARASAALKRPTMIGESPALAQCLDLAAQAAGTDSSVLITGETGTGKEMLAVTIHENSHRAGGPFIVVDCSTLPETLVESVLFGHERGAFTGADRKREGLINAADGGTLFLDEVGELPLSLQKSFLRVLQEKRFRPVGAVQELSSDFRLVAATNRDLAAWVQDGRFREDLWFRLQAFRIHLPPLRERKEDLVPLLTHFMSRLHEWHGSGLKGFSDDFLDAVQAYDWPGNVRELKNALESSWVNARGAPTLEAHHLPVDIRIRLKQLHLGRRKPALKAVEAAVDAEVPPFREAIKQAERDYLHSLLSRTSGRVDAACALAGLSRSQLYALLKRNGLRPADY